MNLDNERLRDIQRFKAVYGKELDKADTIEDCLILQGKIDELENEEKQILERFKVEI